MHADEMVLAMVDIVRSHTQVKIEDADGVDFLYILIAFTQRDMFGNGFSHTVEDAFEIMHFAGVLDLNDDNFAFTIQRFDIDTIELVVGTLLIAFAFEYFEDLHFFPHRNGLHASADLLSQYSPLWQLKDISIPTISKNMHCVCCYLL